MSHNFIFHTVAGPDINLLRDDSPQSQGSLCSIDLFFKEVGIDLLATVTYFLQKMVLFGTSCYIFHCECTPSVCQSFSQSVS